MSFYTAGIRTHYIDPINHIKNARSEFRLDPNKVYLSNWRLCGLGTSDASGGAHNPPPNKLAGINGLIKNIRIMDGATILSQFRDFHEYAAWVNVNHSNSSNANVYGKLNGSDLGFRVNYESAIGVVNDTATPNSDLTIRGWFNVREACPMLSAVSYIPTSVFKDLKLVIEYNNNNRDFCEDIRVVPNNADIRPILVVDEVINEDTKNNMMNSFNNISWMEIEKDIFQVADVTGFNSNPAGLDGVPDAVQSVEKRVNGFNNKQVGKLLFVNKIQNDNEDRNGNNLLGGGTAGSKSQFNQRLNVRVNGVPLLPFDGVDNDGFRTALTNDNFGAYNCAAGMNIKQLGVDGNTARDAEMAGRLDYLGLDLAGSQVQDLNITYKRTNCSDTENKFADNMTVSIFGEVMKSLNVSGGQYVVSYA